MSDPEKAEVPEESLSPAVLYAVARGEGLSDQEAAALVRALEGAVDERALRTAWACNAKEGR